MIKITRNSVKPRIPRKVRVGHLTITVKMTDPVKMGGNFGTFNNEKLEIRIDKGALPSMRYTTFIHELLEVVNWVYELRLPHSKIATLETALQDIEVIN